MQGFVYVYGNAAVYSGTGSGYTMAHLYTQKLWILFEHIYLPPEKHLMNIEEVLEGFSWMHLSVCVIVK